jgi:hypothetical protein
MTALLARAHSAALRAKPTSRPVIDGCAPDCFYDYLCDSSHRYFRRLCCYRPDCTDYCGDWVLVTGGC